MPALVNVTGFVSSSQPSLQSDLGEIHSNEALRSASGRRKRRGFCTDGVPNSAPARLGTGMAPRMDQPQRTARGGSNTRRHGEPRQPNTYTVAESRVAQRGHRTAKLGSHAAHSGTKRARSADYAKLMHSALRLALATLYVLVGAACERSSTASPLAGASTTLASAAPAAPEVSAVKEPASPRCPAGMALIDSFCIDRYEAHLVIIDELDQSERPTSPFARPSGAHRYAARSAAGVTPQGYISRNESAEACLNAGKRLCSAREWHRACGGTQETRYPYGSKEIRGRCNTGKPYVPTKLFGRVPFGSVDLNSPLLNQQPGGLARSGEYTECVNDYGLFDMVGNLHEWVADESNSALKRKIPIPYGQHLMGPRGSGVFLGGFFSSKSEHGHGCNYVTTHHAPDYHDYSTGFRCCATPRPK